MSSTFRINSSIMDLITNFIGDDTSDLINLRKFKELGNSYSAQQLELSKINKHTIIEKVHSINPHIDLSTLLEKMKGSAKYKKKDMFASLDMLGSPCVLPIYKNLGSNLQILDPAKSDFCQAKRTRMNAPSPSFIPKRNIVPDQCLLITVSLYDSHNSMYLDEVSIAQLNWRCSSQFHDGQTLADVRRAFVCQTMDNEFSGDVSHNPDKLLDFLENDDLKHALFYINNNVYVDSPPSEIAKDHSAETVKKWTQDNGYMFKKVFSQETQLLDLEICVGEPYIFQHWNQCEHVFVFNEIRFAQPHRSLDCFPRSIII